jgi:hypothetical protein
MLLERKRKNKGYISEIIFDASGMSREVMPEVFVHESFGRMTTFFFFSTRTLWARAFLQIDKSSVNVEQRLQQLQ